MQATSYSGDSDVGCPQRIRLRIITSLARPTTEERLPGLRKAKHSASGRRRARFCGFMANVGRAAGALTKIGSNGISRLFVLAGSGKSVLWYVSSQ
jgi:hypothetical protein